MQQPSNYDEQIHYMQQHIQSLESRIEMLEEKFSKLQA
jgi:prefoldin subunit 5